MNKKEITDYFRSNIFSAYRSYTGWKAIFHARSEGIVSKEMADRYTDIQKYHPQFFGLAENSFLTSFVLLSLHPFDKDPRSYSLFKIDENKTKKFIEENQKMLDHLFMLRNKIFAHRDLEINNSSTYEIPSIESLDAFFDNLMEFYNELCRDTDSSFTIFDNAKNVKYDIEHLYMNLYRGENTRMNEIDIRYTWEENRGKISDII
jgi:hypothetical protein